MRRAAKRDDNEADIIAVLRAQGASVVQVNSKGIPDLLVGIHGCTFLIEVKSPKRAKFTAAQKKFREDWHGDPPTTVRNPGEALLAISRGEATCPECKEEVGPDSETGYDFDAGLCVLCVMDMEAVQ